MKELIVNRLWVVLVLLLVLTSCRSGRRVISVDGGRIAVDSAWDACPDEEAVALLAPYKAKVDSIVRQPLGVSEMSMNRGRPESLLSNLVADLLRESAEPILGKPADIGLMNIGGIRDALPEGIIIVDNVYEILPFENALCLLRLKGTSVRKLFQNIASRRGEGVSGVELLISSKGELLQATVGGKPIVEDSLYTVATTDYLSEGNDGLHALTEAVEKVEPEGAVLRDIFIRYVRKQTAAGKKLTSHIEGRIKVVNP